MCLLSRHAWSEVCRFVSREAPGQVVAAIITRYPTIERPRESERDKDALPVAQRPAAEIGRESAEIIAQSKSEPFHR